MKIRVAVIGAGAAGLCAARHLSKYTDRVEFIVFEQEEDVGGTWRYTDQVGYNSYGIPIHSSMYKYMKTNLPKESMAFPDFPFQENPESFLHHSYIREYLEQYASHFNLYQYIQFHTQVDKVRPYKLKEDQKIQWHVKFHNLDTGRQEEMVFDHIMACNGHYAFPNFPSIDGLQDFKGIVMHSHEYRDNTPFKGMKVVVLGAGPSGTDITLELAEVAKEVILCHNLAKNFPTKLPSNVFQDVGIQSIQKSGVTLKNGKFLEANAIIFCTGYHIKFPFFHPDCQVKIEDERVTPFFRHIIHIDHPSLTVFNLLFRILPFPVFHQQVSYVVKYILGELTLPSREDMAADIEADFCHRREMGFPLRHSHKMTMRLLWEYDDKLSQEGGFPPISLVVRKLFEDVTRLRPNNLTTIKRMHVVQKNGEYILVQ